VKREDKTTFIENLKIYGLGELTKTLEDYQREVVAAVREIGGSGEISLKIKYKLDGDKQVAVVPDISRKLPKKKLVSVSMFATKNNKLAPHDPDQATIEDALEVGKDQANIINMKTVSNGD
jgi:hypothetical protein